MTQDERRLFLIKYLIDENEDYAGQKVPEGRAEQELLLRSLMNIRQAAPVSDEFLRVQDEFLTQAAEEEGITDIRSLSPVRGDLYLWKGDITTFRCDAIVNAANSGMTGCYLPGHNCIDNCIHTFAGVQLRNYCKALMEKQGHDEPVGTAKITPAFNLPSKFVIHTVGPTVYGEPTADQRQQLASCYTSCLELADENKLESIAFCCIATGVFCFPQVRAAPIAVGTVEQYKERTKSPIKVVFDVFSEEDWNIYAEVFG